MTEEQINIELEKYSSKYDIVFYDEVMASVYSQYIMRQDSTILYTSIIKCLSRISQFYKVNLHRLNDSSYSNPIKQPIFLNEKLLLSMLYVVNKESITENLSKINVQKVKADKK